MGRSSWSHSELEDALLQRASKSNKQAYCCEGVTLTFTGLNLPYMQWGHVRNIKGCNTGYLFGRMKNTLIQRRHYNSNNLIMQYFGSVTTPWC